MKLNAQQRAERLNLYGLVQGLSYVIRLNDIRTVQHLRARLALVLRNSDGLAKPLHAEIKRLFVISGVWVRNVGDRHQTKRHVLQIIRRIIPRLNRPLTRGKLERAREAGRFAPTRLSDFAPEDGRRVKTGENSKPTNGEDSPAAQSDTASSVFLPWALVRARA